MNNKRVCLFPNEMRDVGLDLTREICAFLKERGVRVFMPQGTDLPSDACVLDDQAKREPFDFALSLGGDGTVLRAAQELIGTQIPLLGINLGYLGYLNEVERVNWRPAVEKLLNQDFSIQKRMRLSAVLEFVDDEGKVLQREEYLALNDVVLRRADTSGAIILNLSINGAPIDSLKADGVILATPTGSTAYNLAANGPILNPVARGFVVTPLCCHSMLSRPLVLDPGDTIMVAFNPVSYQEAPLLSVDGLKHIRLEQKTQLYITGAPAEDDFVMAKVTNQSFYEVLKNKI